MGTSIIKNDTRKLKNCSYNALPRCGRKNSSCVRHTDLALPALRSYSRSKLPLLSALPLGLANRQHNQETTGRQEGKAEFCVPSVSFWQVAPDGLHPSDRDHSSSGGVLAVSRHWLESWGEEGSSLWRWLGKWEGSLRMSQLSQSDNTRGITAVWWQNQNISKELLIPLLNPALFPHFPIKFCQLTNS